MDDIRAFLEGKEARYQWIQETLIRFKYRSRGKKERGLILRYLERVSGYSRAQVKRLLQQYGKRGKIERQQRTVAGFERYLILVLEEIKEAFPFIIKGFHADNGSEYINRRLSSYSKSCASN